MASRGINKVILVGNLGNDPEIRYMPNGGAVANITIATSESWRDKATGEQREKTEWHRVALFGKLAEVAGEYLRKGSQVYVEGKLKTRKWKGDDGIQRYSTEVHVSEFNFLSNKNDMSGSIVNESTTTPLPNQQSTSSPENSDDLPF